MSRLKAEFVNKKYRAKFISEKPFNYKTVGYPMIITFLRETEYFIYPITLCKSNSKNYYKPFMPKCKFKLK